MLESKYGQEFLMFLIHSERLFGFLIEPLLLRRAEYTRN